MNMQLQQQVSERVAAWRIAGYPSDDHPAIAEIFDWAVGQAKGNPRFLRLPQVRALETYWYLRLVENTPHVYELYSRLAANKRELRESLGLNSDAMRDFVEEHSLDQLIDRIRTNDNFVRQHGVEALRETLTLDYASYILALAMGAGKTVLIGAIIATEFAMAQEYPEADFVQNALVFAPGKTILESLRELAAMPFDCILPPRMHKLFAASVKLTFTRDGSPDIDVIPGSRYNIVVTNTEKIRIRSEDIRKSDIGALFNVEGQENAKQEVANRRLQRLAQLPHLAVFSDEAHHTYGQSMDKGLKKVRMTVDYLAANTNVVCVVNTTGTPYYRRQPLLDVTYWYGLSQGIADGYLKPLAGNIETYDLDGDVTAYVHHVVIDFFKHYRDVCLPNDAPAKLAIYFPQTDDLAELRPVVEAALVECGLPPTLCLSNTSESPQADIDAFNRLNDPTAPHRVILLVNKGTEGWNCPSLFACALARKLKASNNFVLQAATRCLRQVPGNTANAKVYLSKDNYSILDRQLQETYGESLSDLSHDSADLRRTRIVLRKLDVPPMVVTRELVRVVRVESDIPEVLHLTEPEAGADAITMRRFELAQQASTTSVLRQLGDSMELSVPVEEMDAYAVAADLCSRYRLDLWQVLDALRNVYAQRSIPMTHLPVLAGQIEQQTRHYTVEKETVEVALALVRPEGFREEVDPGGNTMRTAEIVYHKDRADRLWKVEDAQAMYGAGFGFHYSPYNFDSLSEKSLLDQVLQALKIDPHEIEDVYFTGAISDRGKTDFVVEYRDEAGRWRPYSPDFVLRRKPAPGAAPGSGKVLIIEVKAERERKHPVDGERGRKAMALRDWERLNPERLKYEMIFTDDSIVPADRLKPVRDFIKEPA